MKHLIRLSIFVCAVLLNLSPAAAQLLYSISGNGLESPSYIFGTHHLAPLSVADSIKGMEKALSDTQTVVGELVMADNMPEIIRATMKYMPAPPDSTLTSLLSPEEMERASSQFEAIMGPSMKLASLAAMRPMFVSTVVTMAKIGESIGHDPSEQLDTYFQQKALEQGKEIIGLETADYQARILYTSVPISLQLKELLEILENPDKLIADVNELNALYMAQDLTGLYEMSSRDDSNPEFTRALIDRRNAEWLKALPDILKEGPCFIAVGALHLPGPQGVLEGLRALGYEITSVN